MFLSSKKRSEGVDESGRRLPDLRTTRNGRIVMNSLEEIASSFFTVGECMAANLRSILAAYAGLITWPPPDPLPIDQNDPDQLQDLHTRLHQAKLDLFGGEQVRMCGGVPVRITE